MPLSSGSLNRLARFERRDPARNEFNEEVGEWVEFARCYGHMRGVTGREFFQALQSQAQVSSRFSCRWTPVLAGVRTSDRMVADDRVYDIQASFDPTGRRRELEFLVVEHQGGT